MTLTRPNRSAATLTKNRTGEHITPISGMCVTCVDGCIGMCEIGKSAYRGPEAIYPQPFGITTSASEKDYPIDMSYFNIMGTAVGAKGIDEDSDKAIFPNVNIETKIGKDKKIKLRVPWIIPGLGSTNVAKNNWEGLAVGAAISGFPLTIGENVAAMDPDSKIVSGKVKHAPDLEWRVKLYKKWQRDGYGDIIVQANVEDTRLGVQEYAISELGVETVELKWGQGAKDIGGEVKIKNLEKAQLLKKRGYVVLPNPLEAKAVEAYKQGSFKEFERHSRVGMVTEKDFMSRVKELRDYGAKHVFLKTGAYRPSDLARAVKFSSKAEIDLLTVDAAGGGTGMSPWRMMNEWGLPQVEIYSLLFQYIEKLAKKKQHIPDIALAGGFILEDQIFKGLSIAAPYVKLIGMARGHLAAAMVGKTIGQKLESGETPVYVGRFGRTKEEIFITVPQLKQIYGNKFDEIPPGAIGVYTYSERLAQGLRQLMTGARKFSLDHITRDDIAALTRETADVSGIQYIMDVDKKEVEKILG